MKRLPPLPALLTFEAVARHQSFSKAGRELHVTQGAVSHRIRALEDAVGVALLTRTSRQVSLTDPGRVLFVATQEAMGRLQLGLAEMKALRPPSRVTVSCSPSFAIRWLVPHLESLRAHAPEVELHISADDQLVEPVSGSIDICIRFGAGGYDRVESRVLTEEHVTAVCSPLYRDSVGLEALEDLRRCVLLHDDVLSEHSEHLGWAEWLSRADLGDVDVRPGLRFSHSYMALDAAAAGQGVALARRSLVRQDLASGRLVTPLSLEVESGLTYWVLTPMHRPRGTAVDLFLDWLRAAIVAEDEA